MRLAVLLFLLHSVQVNAQQREWTLKGYLGVEGGESYTFKLQFTDSSGYLKGCSYTWLHEQKQVKARIAGSIDRKNKTLSFREENILHNNGFESATTICLINAVLKYSADNGRMVLSGQITSSDIGNVYCSRGTIRFTDSETLSALFAESPTKEMTITKMETAKKTSSKPIRIVYDTSSSNAFRSQAAKKLVNEPEKVTDGKEKIYEWHSDSVVVSVWDGGRVDGDVISILFNNATVLEKFPITKEAKRISLPVSEKEVDIITIIANNEGNEPPNTANVLLKDGNREYSLVAYNVIGKKAIIRIRKVK